LSLSQSDVICFQCRFIGIMNQSARARIDQHAIMKMRPLLLRIRVKKDPILDARHDRTFVSHIDRDHISNMNGLAVVVAHLDCPSTGIENCGDARLRQTLEYPSVVYRTAS
jgi:hypothetical protein